MKKKIDFLDEKALNHFYKEAAAIKANFTNKRLESLLSSFDKVIREDFFRDVDRAKSATSGLPMDFYNEMALDIEHHVNNHPEFWMMYDSRMGLLFNADSSSYIINKIFENAPGSQSEYLYKGLLALNNDSSDLALLYFSHFDHYIGRYYQGLCYINLKSYANAIKNLKLFLNGLNAYFIDCPIPLDEFDPRMNMSLMMYRWEVYRHLAYLYNETHNYHLSIEAFEEASKLFTLKEVYHFSNHEEQGELSDFEAYVNNQLFALSKIGAFKDAAVLLKKALEIVPTNTYFQKDLERIQERLKRHETADEILKNVFRIKRPFNIEAFSKTQSLAREKVLEDLIVEQIKRRFEVFDKKLKIYEDERIYGRQYFVKGANGRLDLLLIDKDADVLYVVELKRGLAGIEVLEQIENYMMALAEEIQKPIKGIICLHQANPELTKLVKAKKDIELFTYHFDFRKLG